MQISPCDIKSHNLPREIFLQINTEGELLVIKLIRIQEFSYAIRHFKKLYTSISN